MDYSPWGRKDSGMTEWLSLHLFSPVRFIISYVFLLLTSVPLLLLEEVPLIFLITPVQWWWPLSAFTYLEYPDFLTSFDMGLFLFIQCVGVTQFLDFFQRSAPMYSCMFNVCGRKEVQEPPVSSSLKSPLSEKRF